VCGTRRLADELTWTFSLRDELAFHDGEKVLSKDCVMSLKHWASRDSFGQQLTRVTNEIVALDDRRFQIRLKKPFRQMLYGLGARSCFMMPERMAKTPASEQVKETVGSGPFRFLPARRVGVRRPQVIPGLMATCRVRNRRVFTRAQGGAF
jgi:peptide/nickel transport system substrate-binding protein